MIHIQGIIRGKKLLPHNLMSLNRMIFLSVKINQLLNINFKFYKHIIDINSTFSVYASYDLFQLLKESLTILIRKSKNI